MRFHITAADRQGKEHSLTIDAPDEMSAIATMRKRGLFPFKVIEMPIYCGRASSLFSPAPEQETPRTEAQEESAVLICETCGKIMAKALKACPHCGSPRKRTKAEERTALLEAIGVLCLVTPVILGLAIFAHACSKIFSTPSRPYSPASIRRTSDYRSTKPVRDMDGWERKQIDEAWDSMSPEERRKQIYRDFGDIVDIIE